MSAEAQFLAPTVEGEEDELDRSLRPRRLDEFVGQERIKEQLSIALEATRSRGLSELRVVANHALRNSAMAIGPGLAYALIIENLVFGLLSPLGAQVKQIHDWFPIGSAGHLQQSFGEVSSVVGFRVSNAGAVDTTLAVVVLVFWIGGLAAISGGLSRIRDIA